MTKKTKNNKKELKKALIKARTLMDILSISNNAMLRMKSEFVRQNLRYILEAVCDYEEFTEKRNKIKHQKEDDEMHIFNREHTFAGTLPNNRELMNLYRNVLEELKDYYKYGTYDRLVYAHFEKALVNIEEILLYIEENILTEKNKQTIERNVRQRDTIQQSIEAYEKQTTS